MGSDPISWQKGPDVLITFIVINATVCIVGLGVNLALRRHLQKHHPLLWNGFRFPHSSPLVDRDDEKAEVLAQAGLSESLRSGAWRALGDARLDRLVHAQRLCFYAVVVAMTACLVATLMQAG
jgi:hypothetical protein